MWRVCVAGALLGLASCGTGDAGGKPGGLTVCATISPLADWLKEIVGDDGTVVCLVSGGKDPHHFEPTARDAVAVGQSKAVFAVGLGLDPWAAKLADSGGSTKLVTVSDGMQAREFAPHEIHVGAESVQEAEHAHGGKDPHFWHDPRRAKIVVAKMAEKLAQADPGHAENFKRRAQACAAKLEALDGEIETLAKAIPNGAQVVTFHDAFGYLFERLHVNVAAVVEVSPGVEPSIRDCTEAVRALKAIGQRVVFREPGSSDRAIEILAQNAGITQIETLDPLDNDATVAGKDYFERMRHNLDVLKRVLVRQL
jgi:ABC-type Zn uptake system ZnuABC Zn-binding protein ZnuA